MTVEEIISTLKLEPLPFEGGLFRQTYVSKDVIKAGCLPERYGHDKSACTAIYYLLTGTADSFSALHRLPTDEIYHFYLGDPVELLVLYPSGRSEVIVLGQDIGNGQQVQFIVPRECWQGARVVPGGGFALLGTTVAPGYDQADFSLGQRDELIMRYPLESKRIQGLTH